ncbi:MAG: 50S ribosomal protein L34 [Patescibacteria group bacterium]
MSFTYKPKKKKRARTHGFLKRKKTKTGRTVVKKRRRKGRKKLTV